MPPTTTDASARAGRLRAIYDVPTGDVPRTACQVEGVIPQWLTGTLLRNSATRFDVGAGRVPHLFDGLAMLHAFTVRDGATTYTGRMLDTADRRSRAAEGHVTLAGFAVDPCRSRFQRFMQLFKPALSDNANVNIARLGDEFLALTELPMPVSFDPETLETLGISDALPPGPGKVAHTTAHPLPDAATGELVHYMTRFGPRSQYEVHATRPHGNRRLARLAVREPSYMHSFGLTDRHVVLHENALVVNPLDLARARAPFIQNYRWKPELGSRLHLFDRATGEHRGVWETDAAFCFHHVNTFEDGDETVVDMVVFDDPTIIDELYLDHLDDDARVRPQNRVRRLRLAPGGKVTADETLYGGESFELPRIDDAQAAGRPYRYTFATGFLPDGPGAADPSLLRIDLERGEAARWQAPGQIPGEPVFASAPDAREEGDGVVLSVVLDTASERSYLLVLDGRTFEELGRAWAPQAVPLSFHGSFFTTD